MAPASPRRDRTGSGALQADPTAALRDAAALLRRGRAAEAVAAYRRIVKTHGDHPEAHHNLGVALRADGRDEEAIAAYRRAIELRPAYAAANHHLAQALDAAGRPMDALKHHFLAYRLARDRVDFAQALASALRPIRMKSASPAVIEALTGLYGERDVDHQDLMAVTASLILARDGVGDAIKLAAKPWDKALPGLKAWWEGQSGRALARDTLFLALLRETIVADETTEALVVLLRRLLLEAALEGASFDHDLGAAIAGQAWAAEFVLAESKAEARALATLPDSVEGALAWAMYRPLAARAGNEGLLGQSAPLDEQMRRQVDEPAQEHILAEAVPALTAIEDSVSRAVRQQYEDNPYPRWRAIVRRPARKLAEVVAELFPAIPVDTLPTAPPRILVAGCGTGRHALSVAYRYAEADILAVDLSRAALGYAQRRTRALGVDNIRYRQADILKLGAIEERFDLIESSGVLHHMADPEAGWAVLTGLLKPGGFLKLGLYSATGRQAIAAARGFVAEQEFPPTAEGIRQARQAIRALPPEHPARKVADELDFASASTCRDLLFHVQEDCFTLPRIDAAIRRFGLQFLGFEIADDTTRATYAKAFPEDRRRDDLDRWRRFEEQRPQSFRTMYQFWCRKP